MSKKYSFLIQAKHVFDGKQKSTYEGFLCLKDKQIVKMGKGKASQKIQEEAEEILEFDKELVMPGVTDTHTFFTGYAVFHLGVDVSEIKTNEEGEKALRGETSKECIVWTWMEANAVETERWRADVGGNFSG